MLSQTAEHLARTPLGRVWENTGMSPAFEIHALLERLQGEGVVCRNHHEIRDYLLRFPDLVEVIPVAVGAAQEHFPRGSSPSA